MNPEYQFKIMCKGIEQERNDLFWLRTCRNVPIVLSPMALNLKCLDLKKITIRCLGKHNVPDNLQSRYFKGDGMNSFFGQRCRLKYLMTYCKIC